MRTKEIIIDQSWIVTLGPLVAGTLGSVDLTVTGNGVKESTIECGREGEREREREKREKREREEGERRYGVLLL
jgi:hypothetical protein